MMTWCLAGDKLLPEAMSHYCQSALLKQTSSVKLKSKYSKYLSQRHIYNGCLLPYWWGPSLLLSIAMYWNMWSARTWDCKLVMTWCCTVPYHQLSQCHLLIKETFAFGHQYLVIQWLYWPLLTLIMLNCFKDYKRYIYILNYILD